MCRARCPDVVKDLPHWQVYFLVDFLTGWLDLSSSSSSTSSTHFVDRTGDKAPTDDEQDEADELLEDIDGRNDSGQVLRSLPREGRPILSGVVGVGGEAISLYALIVELYESERSDTKGRRISGESGGVGVCLS